MESTTVLPAHELQTATTTFGGGAGVSYYYHGGRRSGGDALSSSGSDIDGGGGQNSQPELLFNYDPSSKGGCIVDTFVSSHAISGVPSSMQKSKSLVELPNLNLRTENQSERGVGGLFSKSDSVLPNEKDIPNGADIYHNSKTQFTQNRNYDNHVHEHLLSSNDDDGPDGVDVDGGEHVMRIGGEKSDGNVHYSYSHSNHDDKYSFQGNNLRHRNSPESLKMDYSTAAAASEQHMHHSMSQPLLSMRGALGDSSPTTSSTLNVWESVPSECNAACATECFHHRHQPHIDIEVRDKASWMTALAPILGKLKIREVVLPGTHDTGTYAFTTNSKYSPDRRVLQWIGNTRPIRYIVCRWSKTQNRNIAQQLQDGIRYLDLRLCMRRHKTRADEVWTCHGMYGAGLSEIFNAVREFNERHPKEVIIMDFNHFYDFKEYDHGKLINRIKNTFLGKLWPSQLAQATLSQVWNTPNIGSLVIIYHHRLVQGTDFWAGNLTSHVNDYCQESLIYSPWPATTCSETLREYLHDKLSSRMADDKLFVTQAILTPFGSTIARHVMSAPFISTVWRRHHGVATSVESFADTVNARVKDWISVLWGNGKFQLNIIILDFYEKIDFVDTVIKLNIAAHALTFETL